MKNLIYLLIFCLFFSGCATGFSNLTAERLAVCEKCNKIFTVTSEQVINNQEITCPYCGLTQNLQYALNRYTYLSQQQQDAYFNGLGKGLIDAVHENNEQQYQLRQDIIRNYPYHRSSSSHTTCQKVGDRIDCTTRNY